MAWSQNRTPPRPVDEDAADPATYYADGDEDGYGDLDSPLEACEPPAGYTADASDCDDGNDTVFPGADELCNDSDDDCVYSKVLIFK